MKGKKEYIILAAIIVAVVAYLVWRPTDRTTYELPALSKINKKDITRVDIMAGDQTITINREGDNWIVGPEKFPADAEKIDQMLDTVSTLTLTAMVSESKSDQRYNLTPEKRIRIKAFKKDDLLREITVGKAADTFRHTFIKIAGDERVFHAKNNFRERFEITIDQVRDKQVMAFKTDEITAFKITKNKKTTLFTKKDVGKEEKKDTTPADENAPKSKEPGSIWITGKDQKADSAKVNAYLTALADLNCKQYMEDSKEDISKNQVVTINLTGKKAYELSIYAALEENKDDDAVLWPASSSENNYPFLLADWKAKEIVKDPADLMPDAPESAPEKDTNKGTQ